MRDMSINLPSWALRLGYRLAGDLGTIGELFLYRNDRAIRMWRSTESVPNIIEMEEILRNLEEVS